MKKSITGLLAGLAGLSGAGAIVPPAHAAPPTESREAPPKVKPDAKLKTLLPKAPKGYSGPKGAVVRTPADIFEQINGGSVSFLENGMTDAVFAMYPLKGGTPGTEIQIEVYRFKDAAGAGKQFKQLLGEPGKEWQGGHAVQHEFGTEAVVGRFILRSTFADGPDGNRTTSTALAEQIAPKLQAP